MSYTEGGGALTVGNSAVMLWRAKSTTTSRNLSAGMLEMFSGGFGGGSSPSGSLEAAGLWCSEGMLEWKVVKLMYSPG